VEIKLHSKHSCHSELVSESLAGGVDSAAKGGMDKPCAELVSVSFVRVGKWRAGL